MSGLIVNACRKARAQTDAPLGECYGLPSLLVVRIQTAMEEDSPTVSWLQCQGPSIETQASPKRPAAWATKPASTPVGALLILQVNQHHSTLLDQLQRDLGRLVGLRQHGRAVLHHDIPFGEIR